jgi:hypothetical protein
VSSPDTRVTVYIVHIGNVTDAACNDLQGKRAGRYLHQNVWGLPRADEYGIGLFQAADAGQRKLLDPKDAHREATILLCFSCSWLPLATY